MRAGERAVKCLGMFIEPEDTKQILMLLNGNMQHE